MGLDMYLRASEYVSRNDVKNDELVPNPLFAKIVEQFDCTDVIDTDGFAGISIDLPMGYWRKANQIHAWFVNNLGQGEDNCQVMYVGREQLEELKGLCEQVLADNSLAQELLPPQAGFFFGSYEIDEWYMQDIKNTIEIIDRCLNSKFDYFEYQASW